MPSTAGWLAVATAVVLPWSHATNQIPTVNTYTRRRLADTMSPRTTMDDDNDGFEFSSVRSDIPAIPILDGIYVPMSNVSSTRLEFMKRQYQSWFHTCAPDPASGRQRGNNTGECWRSDPGKALFEFARRIQLVFLSQHDNTTTTNDHEFTENVTAEWNDLYQAVLLDAQSTAEEFLSRQDFSYRANRGCSPGGLSDVPGVNSCDSKYWGHASPAWFRHKVEGQPYPYTPEQAELMKHYCFEQGWSGGFVNVQDLSDPYTERLAGLGLQCLVDLYKANVTDVTAELATVIDYHYSMFTGDYSGQVIGAPMHSMDVHECNGYCPDMRYWIFSPWMGSAFLIPALWEYYVFVDQDPRVAHMMVLFGDALLSFGIVRPDVWTMGEVDPRSWMLDEKENPTDWITLYFANPYNLTQAIMDQDSEGWYSDLHNPEAMFALSAAFFLSCNERFLDRVEEMWDFFNEDNAVNNREPIRLFLWQHRGSASTEWLLEHANCSSVLSVLKR